MAYASHPDVSALNKQRYPSGFAANTKPTAGEVGNWLTRTAAELDGMFAAQGYSVPIATSATQSYELAKHYNSLAVGCLVEQAAEQSDRRDQACAAWEAVRDALKAGEIELPDAGKDSTNSQIRYPAAPTAVFSATTVW